MKTIVVLNAIQSARLRAEWIAEKGKQLMTLVDWLDFTYKVVGYELITVKKQVGAFTFDKETGCALTFNNEEDALLFKLRW